MVCVNIYQSWSKLLVMLYMNWLLGDVIEIYIKKGCLIAPWRDLHHINGCRRKQQPWNRWVPTLLFYQWLSRDTRATEECTHAEYQGHILPSKTLCREKETTFSLCPPLPLTGTDTGESVVTNPDKDNKPFIIQQHISTWYHMHLPYS